MPAPTRLVLVRHGESTWNAESRLQGQSDPVLSSLGRAQAARLYDSLAPFAPDGSVCSDLMRARETAALADHPGARPDPRWREIDLGIWSGRLESDVPAGELAAFRRGEHVPLGGETWDSLVRRVADAVEELAAAGGTWLVFTHGGAIRAATAHVVETSIQRIAGPANCSVTLLELHPLRRVLAYNRTDEPRLPAPSEPGGTGAEPDDAPA